MNIRIPGLLRSYTNGQKNIEIQGERLIDVINNMDKKYPGIKFRFITEQETIREHMRIFVNNEEVNNINLQLSTDDEIFIIQALSGG